MVDGVPYVSSSESIRDAIMITIKPPCSTLQEFAKRCAAKKEKPLKSGA
jgi:hypothetical protein